MITCQLQLLFSTKGCYGYSIKNLRVVELWMQLSGQIYQMHSQLYDAWKNARRDVSDEDSKLARFTSVTTVNRFWNQIFLHVYIIYYWLEYRDTLDVSDKQLWIHKSLDRENMRLSVREE